ncbi:uncharacterized protein Dwil_GK11517 [Drosophila willistoni]|uniref:Uncharacterized protein n=1 Tax=Drosophila willistoni TaxID=7260 RepID=B4N999_DROWI|nr:uncharacterized protein LOC6648000 [Drosophila willistoni]EDW80532.2 uncharacterized protein Dwil_GK11517 [Drosophila willistoni]
MRQRLMQQMHRQKLQQQQQQLQARNRAQSQPHSKLTNSCSTQTFKSLAMPRLARSTEQLPASHFEDYRKNLFGGTLTRRCSEEELQDESFIVNAAFDEIFSRYDDDDEGNSSLDQPTNTLTNTDDLFEDEHMLVSLSELDDDVFATKSHTASTTPTTMAAGRTPKHSTPQLNLNKYPAPAPPRSRTLTNLFERLKPEHKLQKYPAEQQLNQADFNRGSTISKSFVQQLKRPSHKQKRAPKPPPKPQQTRSHVAIAHVTPLRNALIFPKRSKSSNELPLDDLNVQARKYYRKSEQSVAL